MRFIAPRCPWLVWNPVVKYCERMYVAPYGVGAKILPLLNGKPTEDALIDANRLVSFFGWGWLWGFQLQRDADGTVRSVTTPRGQRPVVPTWRFGRITITYHKHK